MLTRWRLVHELEGIVALGRCGTRFGVQEGMHWPSKLRICKGREGRGLCCVGGGEPCSMGLWLAQAPAMDSWGYKGTYIRRKYDHSTNLQNQI